MRQNYNKAIFVIFFFTLKSTISASSTSIHTKCQAIIKLQKPMYNLIMITDIITIGTWRLLSSHWSMHAYIHEDDKRRESNNILTLLKPVQLITVYIYTLIAHFQINQTIHGIFLLKQSKVSSQIIFQSTFTHIWEGSKQSYSFRIHGQLGYMFICHSISILENIFFWIYTVLKIFNVVSWFIITYLWNRNTIMIWKTELCCTKDNVSIWESTLSRRGKVVRPIRTIYKAIAFFNETYISSLSLYLIYILQGLYLIYLNKCFPKDTICIKKNQRKLKLQYIFWHITIRGSPNLMQSQG